MSNMNRPNIGLVPSSSGRLPHVQRGIAYRIGQLIAVALIASITCLLLVGIWWLIVQIIWSVSAS